MPNPLIVLDSVATAASQLQTLLNSKDKAIFLVLGGTPDHNTLANAAAADALMARRAVLVKDPTWVQATLKALNVTDEPPIPAYSNWFACCINFSTDIIEIYTDDDKNNITPCFLLASAKTIKKPL